MKSDLNTLLDFVRFTHQIRNVQRAILFETEDRHENDAEHGYQMALMALYLIDKHQLELDRYKCIAMALVHDIVEAYAGDTTVFASKKDRAAQAAKENLALEQLKRDWPEAPSLHKLIEEYEKHETPEGKFVYALDKLMPEINNYLFEGKAWKAQKITWDQVKKIKEGKIEVDAVINGYHQELLNLMKDADVFWKPEESSPK